MKDKHGLQREAVAFFSRRKQVIFLKKAVQFALVGSKLRRLFFGGEAAVPCAARPRWGPGAAPRHTILPYGKV
jgi:hypothetical protein